jgi:hypothetical protein
MLLFDAAGDPPMSTANGAAWAPRRQPAARRRRCTRWPRPPTCSPAARGGSSRAPRPAPPRSTVVSNVPGPPVDLEILGRRVTAIFPAVPFLYRHALSIGAVSYGDRLHCGVYADAAAVPDCTQVARDLEAAFDALRVVPRAPDTPWRARARAVSGRPGGRPAR